MSSNPFDAAGERRCDVAERICDASARACVAVSGRVISAETTRHGSSIACRVELDDGTGTLALLFLGRVTVPGLAKGAQVRVWGRAIADRGGLVVWNPRYELVAEARG